MPVRVQYRNIALYELLDFRDQYELYQPGKGYELAGLVSRSLGLVARFPEMQPKAIDSCVTSRFVSSPYWSTTGWKATLRGLSRSSTRRVISVRR